MRAEGYFSQFGVPPDSNAWRDLIEENERLRRRVKWWVMVGSRRTVKTIWAPIYKHKTMVKWIPMVKRPRCEYCGRLARVKTSNPLVQP